MRRRLTAAICPGLRWSGEWSRHGSQARGVSGPHRLRADTRGGYAEIRGSGAADSTAARLMGMPSNASRRLPETYFTVWSQHRSCAGPHSRRAFPCHWMAPPDRPPRQSRFAKMLAHGVGRGGKVRPKCEACEALVHGQSTTEKRRFRQPFSRPRAGYADPMTWSGEAISAQCQSAPQWKAASSKIACLEGQRSSLTRASP